MKKNSIKKSLLPYLLLFIVILTILYFVNSMNNKVNVLTYNEFVTALDKGKIDEMDIVPKTSARVYELTGKLKDYQENESFFVRVPLSDEVVAKIIEANDEYDFKIVTQADPSSNSIWVVFINFFPMILLIGVTFFMLTRQMGGAGKSMDFGKSKAKLSEDNKKIKFDKVAGLKEEKEEVQELIDFLKNPKKFQKLGARIPKGVLLVGPPGTGKTLLARAVAGEANVPFYYISGSDFVELFVGIGGGHDEREQTLNQLLTEMDGFGANEGIIIIAATNRPDVLDPALLRPGRFDRQVTVNLPDVKGREEILDVHAKNKVFAKNVKLYNIAKRTVGFSGADLENLLNEAALLAVRRNKSVITMAEIDEAHDRVLMGPAKKSKKYTEKEKKIVAYHEAGHAVIGLKLDGANEVQKITIVPRGAAGGYNLMLPKEETYLQTKNELLHTISGLLAGRVAEETIFKEVTTGAHNDFEKATKIARAMVTEYGMSDLGPVQFEQRESGNVFLGRDYTKSRNFSSQVAFEIDQEQRKIINECYEITKKIIKENKDLLDLIANTLLEYETITKEQIDYLVKNGKMPEDDSEKADEKLEEMTLEELKSLAKSHEIKGYSKMTKDEIIGELKK